jgi:predicted kinase
MSGYYVVVSGAPGSGKTQLARPLARTLGLPLLSKDVIKEALFDELGVGDRLWSRRLGRASITVLYRLAADVPAAVLESVFQRDFAVADLKALGKPLIEVHCVCDPQLAIERFQKRADTERHPGHLDNRQPLNKLEQLVHEGSTPLGLGGPLLEVDTTGEVAIDEVAAWVRAQPEAQGAG